MGVLGGTFDPVHLGHLIIAQEASYRLGLERVLFLPAGQPWLKEGRPITPAHHRLEMLRRAIAGDPAFALSTLEVERPGPSYTVDTLPLLKREARGELYFILGLDSLADLPRWHQPERLIRLCRLVGMPRPGYSSLDLAALERAIPGVGERVVLLPDPEIGISATEIRGRVARGQPIRYLVPEAVEGYIREQGLYAANTSAS